MSQTLFFTKVGADKWQANSVTHSYTIVRRNNLKQRKYELILEDKRSNDVKSTYHAKINDAKNNARVHFDMNQGQARSVDTMTEYRIKKNIKPEYQQYFLARLL